MPEAITESRLDFAIPDMPDVKTDDTQQLTARHQEIIRLKLETLSDLEIAERVGVTVLTVRNICKSTLGQVQLQMLEELADDDSAAVRRRIDELAPKCMEVLEAVVNGEAKALDSQVPLQLRVKTANGVLDRAGFTPTHKTAILEQGMTWKAIGIPSKDAQWIEAREFSIAEMARWFRCPPSKLGQVIRAQGWSTLEALNTDYVIDSLMPWAVRIEQEIKRKLIMPSETKVFAEVLFAGMLRGDVTARNASYATGRQWGWKSANDVLELENLNGIGPQGDIYLVPMNMTDAKDLLLPKEERQPAPPELPVAPGVPDEEDEEPDLRLLVAEEVRTLSRNATTDAERIRAIAEAHRPLLAGAFERLLEYEAKKNGRNLKDHHARVVKALQGPVRAFCGAVWGVLKNEQLPGVILPSIEQCEIKMATGFVNASRNKVSEIVPMDTAYAVLKGRLVPLMEQLCGIKPQE